MRFNTSLEFVGLEALKVRHAEQIDDFEGRARRGVWQEFHSGHYDWWAFPIHRRSSLGMRWVVYEGEILALKVDLCFGVRHRRGLELVALSWGWDVRRAGEISSPARNQCWQDWPVRLHKMTVSANLFGEIEIHDSLQEYGRLLIQRKYCMIYNGRD